jgi:hypothetical protein
VKLIVDARAYNKGTWTWGVGYSTFAGKHIYKGNFSFDEFLFHDGWHNSEGECSSRATNLLLDHLYVMLNFWNVFIGTTCVEDDILEE